jgi:hypothetical protein
MEHMWKIIELACHLRHLSQWFEMCHKHYALSLSLSDEETKLRVRLPKVTHTLCGKNTHCHALLLMMCEIGRQFIGSKIK